MQRVLLSGLIVFATHALLAAQVVAPPEVAFSGVVQPSSFAMDAAICAPPTHEIECSGGLFFLTSSTIDLDQYIGTNVKLYGTSLVECPMYNIHKVEVPPPATLAICGTGGLGCPIRLRSGPGGLSQHAFLVSLSPGLLPLNPLKGSLQLGEPFFVLANSGAGNFPPEGAAFDFSIPLTTSLTGLTIYFQSVRRNVGPVGPMQFSNPVCIEIVGHVFVCWTPDC